jgi:hypothetical protein
MKTLILSFILMNSWAFAQETEKLPEDGRLIDIDMRSFCNGVLTQHEESAIELSKTITCDKIKELVAAQTPPIIIDKKDKEGKNWKLRFSFGFSRTDYFKTDLDIKSSKITVVIKDVEMTERTSAEHYNPATWEDFGDAFGWIDEPTNTFMLSLEKEKNIFYLTVFHPKYFKGFTYTTAEVGGEPHYDFQSVPEKDVLSTTIPAGSGLLYFANTYHDVIWQLGYGRQFTFFDTKRAGKLSYTIKGDIGINTGSARSVHIKDGIVENYQEPTKFQGYNVSLGHRLEYQRGIVSIFIDNKAIYSKVEHGFYDGTMKYNLLSIPTTFGFGINLFDKKRRR